MNWNLVSSLRLPVKFLDLRHPISDSQRRRLVERVIERTNGIGSRKGSVRASDSPREGLSLNTASGVLAGRDGPPYSAVQAPSFGAFFVYKESSMTRKLQAALNAVTLANMSRQQRMQAALAALTLTGASIALATTSADNDFTDVVTLLTNWAQGSLGRVAALAFFVVGVFGGLLRQSLFFGVTGVGSALVMYYGPGVIDGIFGAIV